MSQARVSYGQKYAESLRALHPQIQVKVNKCVSQLLRDENGPGLNVENLSRQLKSARIDDKYRLIFTQPEKGLFCLLFVGSHDAAYRAAQGLVIPAAPAISKMAFISEPDSFAKLSSPKTIKYLPLYLHLCKLPAGQREATMTFSEIQQVICADLPPSARRYSAWWANDHSRHVQASAWLAAGWQTKGVALSRESVVFVRRT